MFIYHEDEERFVKTLHPEIQKYYWTYRHKFSVNGITIPTDDELAIKKSYVYAWFTKGTPKRTFYIGKGVGSRYRHILSEIKEYEENPNKYKGQRYKILQDKYGIDYEILLNNVSNYEAELFELCMIHEYIKRGEVLLNYAEIPIDCEQVTQWNVPNPAIIKDPFYSHYLGDVAKPIFDAVTKDKLLSASFYDYLLERTPEQMAERQTITDWICRNGGKVTKTIGKNTKCVIIQGKYKYEHVLIDHQYSRDVYSVNDVLNFIS